LNLIYFKLTFNN